MALYALSIDIPGSAGAALYHAWDTLEARFGLRSVKASLRPHVSLLVGTIAPEHIDALMHAAAIVARKTPPVRLALEGISSFDGPHPVFFARVIKSAELENAYDALWRACSAIGFKAHPHYLPGAWIPHVALAHGDLTPELVPAVRAFLRTADLTWKSAGKALDLVRVAEPVHEYVETWPFRGDLHATKKIDLHAPAHGLQSRP